MTDELARGISPRRLYALIRELDGRREICNLGLDEERVRNTADRRNSTPSERDYRINKRSMTVHVATYCSEILELHGDLGSADRTEGDYPVVFVLAEMSPAHAGIGRVYGAFVDKKLAGGYWQSMTSKSGDQLPRDSTHFPSIIPCTVEL